MKKKTKKAPGLFSKPINPKTWEKKYIGKLYLPQDITFLESISKTIDGKIVIDVEKLEKKDRKKLKELSKVIKANRKGMRLSLLIILVLLIGGGLSWELFFKNRVITNLLETQLEKVFEAQVDVDRLDLSLLRASFTIGHIGIANKSKPMENLIDISDIKAQLDRDQLFRGRFHILELGFNNLERGKSRKRSGALIAASPAQTPLADGTTADPGENEVVTKEEKSHSSMIDQIQNLVGDVDISQLLNEQMDNLDSIGKIKSANQEINDSVVYWEGQTKSWQSKMRAWEQNVKYIQSLNSGSFKDINSAQSTFKKLGEIGSSAQSDYEQAQKDYNKALDQWQYGQNLYKDVRTSIQDDYTYLQSLLGAGSTEKVSWASDYFEEVLGAPISKYISWYKKGLAFYKEFTKDSAKESKTKKESKWVARSLPTGPDSPPRFVLKHLYASGTESGIDYNLEVNDITNKPSHWNKEPNINIEWDHSSTGASSAYVDLSGAKISMVAIPFQVGNYLAPVGVDDVKGHLAVDGSMLVQSDSNTGSSALNIGSLSLNIPSLDITTGDTESNIINRVIVKTLQEAKDINVDGKFTVDEDNTLDLSVSSSLDSVFTDAMGNLIKEASATALDELDKQWGDYLKEPLAMLDTDMGELKNYVNQMDSYDNMLKSYQSLASQKQEQLQKEIEERIKKEAEKRLKDASKDAADALKKGLGGLGF
ncbi:hypothetical protein [Spirochaeta cellobiosiphila]|uniref:hypothetical protein n=1 Tax=Spirochaeta cellobiosiphila TaxID=504483 RepID=UPI0004232158|nr:hypothetical protein [Spirochaeta cellobiosiphila]